MHTVLKRMCSKMSDVAMKQVEGKKKVEKYIKNHKVMLFMRSSERNSVDIVNFFSNKDIRPNWDKNFKVYRLDNEDTNESLVEENDAMLSALKELSGTDELPNLFIEGVSIGSYKAIKKCINSGKMFVKHEKAGVLKQMPDVDQYEGFQ